MARTGGVWTLVALLGVCTVTAQQSKPAFEVASVKPQSSQISLRDIDKAMPRIQPGGVFSPTHVTVEGLLYFVYGLKRPEIIGGPDWLRRDLFQIDARAGRDVPAEQIKLMVRSLLDDRFKLVTHREQREMRIGALVRTHPERPLPARLVPMDQCTSQIVNELRRKFPDKYPSPIGDGTISGCSKTGVSGLADLLTADLGTLVIDATGLSGPYYFSLVTESLLARPGTKVDPNRPALATALDEHLGLKLESRRAMVDVLVIDSVQPPTEN